MAAISSSIPKLYFRHGAVCSAKTLNLLAVAHSYKMQGKAVVILKASLLSTLPHLHTNLIVFYRIISQPALDDRFGHDQVKSRAGLVQKADYLIHEDTNIMALPLKDSTTHCILVDEAQFLSPQQIDQLRLITVAWKVPVICYGLRTDFRTNLFPGSQRLLELADDIEEVKTTCFYCNKKAILNLKHVNGVADTSGPTVQLGAEEKYYPTCFNCYYKSVSDADQSPVDAWKTTV
jgi:thymidine kinase